MDQLRGHRREGSGWPPAAGAVALGLAAAQRPGPYTLGGAGRGGHERGLPCVGSERPVQGEPALHAGELPSLLQEGVAAAECLPEAACGVAAAEGLPEAACGVAAEGLPEAACGVA